MAIVNEEYNLTASKIEAIKQEATIPSGYITVELSTKGKLYAPAKFHLRNFTGEDLLGVAVADDDTLPIKIIDMLQKLVYEPDVKIADFHESEVIETLFILYKTFYQSTLTNLDYILTEDDWKYLAKTNGGENSQEYIRYKQDIENRRYVPKVDIDLNSVKFYDLPEDFGTIAEVDKPNGFHCEYSLPRYGDVLIIKKFLEDVFKEKDHQFERIAQIIKFRKDAEDKVMNHGQQINLASIPNVTADDEEKYNEYLLEKSICYMVAVRAIHLENYKGEDVSKLPLEKKFELAKDPELDWSTFQSIADEFGAQKIGINRNVIIKNPITQMAGTYEYPFREFSFITAILSNKSSGVTIKFKSKNK